MFDNDYKKIINFCISNGIVLDYSTEEEFRRSFAVQEMNFDLSVINYGVATYVLAYYDIDENEDVSAYESLKESYVYFINQFAELVYGTEVL
jgi:hypothetical protein